MKQEFIQGFLNKFMFKKLTIGTFSFLRRKEFSSRDTEDAIKNLEREGIMELIKQTGQDPKELTDMSIKAFDHSVKIMRERLVKALDQTAEAIKNKS